jgi:sirohydrochlorin cobaltochelatase
MAERAIIFFAHGSRDPLWQTPMQAISDHARLLDQKAEIRLAYLELSEPALPDVVAELAAAGVTDVTIMPLFLGMGRHARQDLPMLLDALRARHPELSLTLLPALGEDPQVIALAASLAVSPDRMMPKNPASP